MNRSFLGIVILVLLAFGFWFVSFYLNPYNFWLEMGGAVFLLALFSLATWRTYDRLFRFWGAREVVLGLGSAAILYGIFWFGDKVVSPIFPFAEGDIASVYSNAESAPLAVIGILLVAVIGPGEEIFWRGTVQNALQDKYGGFISVGLGALIYSLVHVWALNLTLLLAALICGLIWGWIYYREESLAPVIISHSVWSLMIFVIFPV